MSAAVATVDAATTRPEGMPDMVEAYARLTVFLLRENRISDSDILATYTTPHAQADAYLENRQIATAGQVEAPAPLVKQRIRELLAATAATPGHSPCGDKPGTPTVGDVRRIARIPDGAEAALIRGVGGFLFRMTETRRHDELVG
jgi:hypothetical protein